MSLILLNWIGKLAIILILTNCQVSSIPSLIETGTIGDVGSPISGDSDVVNSTICYVQVRAGISLIGYIVDTISYASYVSNVSSVVCGVISTVDIARV